MIYELATIEELHAVYDLVQHTIKKVYPKYYPAEVVLFFCELHSKEAIKRDIENGYVSVLKIDGNMIRHIWMLHCLQQNFMKNWDFLQ